MSNLSFGTIRNNTALKLTFRHVERNRCFGTIRNNTALKQNEFMLKQIHVLEPFETTQL